MLNPEPAVFIPASTTTTASGWTAGNRVASASTATTVHVMLARPGVIKGVDIDTRHFTGNFPPSASVEACSCRAASRTRPPNGPKSCLAELQGNSHHYHEVSDANAYTHLRFNIYPDGGIARLRVYGEPHRLGSARRNEQFDLAAMENGAYWPAHDQHFGARVNDPDAGPWREHGRRLGNRRRRDPGNDWAIVALAQPGVIEKIVVDTAHFKGNYPDRCSIQAAYVTGGTDSPLVTQAMFWPVLLASRS